jgi:uncharacterized protein (DUF2062 family)
MQESLPPKRRINLLFRLRPILRWVLRLRSSPKAIAGGLGIGVFVAFTPTFGIQLILAVLLATLFNMNRPASLIPVWITNPVTIAPIYSFNYWLGLKMWDGPPLSEVSGLFINIGKTMTRLEFWDIQEQIMAIFHISDNILIPLILGSVAIGLVTGVLTYFISYQLLTAFLNRRAQKRRLNNPRK